MAVGLREYEWGVTMTHNGRKDSDVYPMYYSEYKHDTGQPRASGRVQVKHSVNKTHTVTLSAQQLVALLTDTFGAPVQINWLEVSPRVVNDSDKQLEIQWEVKSSD